MSVKRKICIVTGSRAEYGLLYWLMKEIQEDADLQLQVIATAMHLSPKFGLTYKKIESDGFRIDWKVDMPLEDDANVAIAKSIGVAIMGFSEAFSSLVPHVVVLLGDRFEILSAAIAATILKIPVAHIHGGESTLGAFDESIRHAVTKMSLLHFAAAPLYRQTIIQMGEAPKRVFYVGAPGLEHLERTPLLSREDLEKQLSFSFGYPTFLVTFHPVTLEEKTSRQHIEQLLRALDAFPDAHILFTGANADPDNFVIRDFIEPYVKHKGNRAIYFTSLGSRLYLSALKHVDLVIGNSSSGIIEAPAFKKPTVNVGDRQKGRLMADSIIQCTEASEEIEKSIKMALSKSFQEKLPGIHSLYSSGKISLKIRKVLKEFPLEKTSLKKGFYRVHI